MIVAPASEAETAEAVAVARASGRRFVIEGGGTRAGLGRPVEAKAKLSTRNLTGITLYEPTELVLSARAGTPLAEVEAALEERKQCLAFEPMDHRALFNTQGEPTIGAIAACNISGPRRVAAGAARDHLIGLRFVNGLGEIIKTGGRVMKNVTGLDLVKLLCGAHGTLGMITEATFKVLPQPETSATLALRGLSDGSAIATLCAALGAPLRVTGAAHLPAGLATPEALTILRVEGSKPSVDERSATLAGHLSAFGLSETLEADYAAALWQALRHVIPLAQPREAAIWRISIEATKAPRFVDLLLCRMAARHYYDWGGGLIWLSVEAGTDAGADKIRSVLKEVGGAQSVGHATLIRAPEDVRAGVEVFEPLPAPLMKITKGIKASFDPDGLFNFGRMYAGV